MAGLGFSITADDKDLLATLKRDERAIDSYAKKFEQAGDNIDNSFEKTTEVVRKQITEQKELIKLIEGDLSELQDKLAKSSGTSFYNELIKEVFSAKQALTEEKAVLAELESKFEETSESGKRLTVQIREMKDELYKMEQAGKGGSKEFNELKQKIVETEFSIKKLNKGMSTLSRADGMFQGIVSGVSGIAGVFSAGAGAAALFGAKSEDLAKIQTRLQALMAITIGLQQAYNTLQSESALRQAVIPAIVNAWTNAQKALNVQLGISNALSKGLMIGGIGLLIAGIILLANNYGKLKKSQEDLALERLNKSLSETAKKKEELAGKTSTLTSVIQDETKSIYEQVRAYQELKKVQPKALEGVSFEQVKSMSKQELDKRFSTQAGADEFSEADAKIKEITSSLEKLEKSKKLALARGTGASVLIDLEKQLEINRADLKVWEDRRKIMHSAYEQEVFMNRPAEERLQVYKDELIKVEAQKSEIEKIIALNPNLTESLKPYLKIWDVLNGKAHELKSNISTIETPNKHYWKNEKKAADDLIAANSIAWRKTKEGQEAIAKSKKAEKELKSWDFSEGAENKRLKELEKQKEAQIKFEELKRKLTKDTEASNLSAMEEGRKKRIAVFELERTESLNSIEKQRDELIKAYNDANKLRGNNRVTVDTFEKVMPKEAKNLNEQKLNTDLKYKKDVLLLNKDTKQELEKIWNEANAQYTSSLDRELISIDNTFKELKKSAKEAGVEISKELDDLQKKNKETAKTKSELEKAKLYEALKTEEFTINMSEIGMIEYVEREKTKLLKQGAEQRLEVLKKMGTEQANEEAMQLKLVIEGYDKSLSKPKSIKSIIDEKTFKIVEDQFKKVIADEGEATKATIRFFEGFKQGGEVAVDVLSNMKGLFGGLDKDLDAAMDAALNIAEGFAKGGIAGGISAAAGELISAVGKFITAKKEVDEALVGRLDAAIEAYDRIISAQIDGVSKLAGKDIRKEFEDIQKNVDARNEAARKKMQEYASSGSGLFSHSEGYKEDKNLSKYKDVLKEVGIETTKVRDMTKEQMITLMSMPAIWGDLNQETRDYIQSLADGEDELKTMMDDLSEMLLGFDASSVSSAIIDSITDPSIDNAIGNFEGKMDDMIRGVIKNIISQNMLIGPITQAMDKLKIQYTDKGVAIPAEALKEFKEEAVRNAEIAKETWESMVVSLRESGIELENTREGMTGKGLAQASQDSINELSGRTLATNIILSEIREIGKIANGNDLNMLFALNGISLTNQSMDSTLKSSFTIFEQQLAVQQQISANTRELIQMRKDLSEIVLHGITIRD